MDFKSRADDWGKEAAVIKKEHGAEVLIPKTTEIQTELLKLEQTKSAVDDAAEHLPKKLNDFITTAEDTLKAIEGFDKAAKDQKFDPHFTVATIHDLNALVNTIKTLKEALVIFEKKTG